MTASPDFDSIARTRTRALIDALNKQRADALQSEIEALRSFAEARTRELKDAQADAGAEGAVESLVTELCAAARTEADKRVRAAEQRAERTLAQARDQAAAELRQAQDVHLVALEQLQGSHRTALDELQGSHSAVVDQLQGAHRAALDQQQESHRAALEQQQESHRAVLQQLEQVRGELGAARAHASEQAARAELAEAEVDAAQTGSAALLADVEEAREMLASAQQNADEAIAAAERDTLGAQAARDEAVAAKRDLAARLEAAERTAAQAYADRQALSDRLAHARVAVLDRLVADMRAMQRATSGQDVFQVLLERLVAHFERAAIFIAGPAGLKCWLHRESGRAGAAEAGAPHTAVPAPASQALETQEIVEVDADASSPATGLFGHPVSTVLAVPIIARDRAIAVAYAESGGELSKEDVQVGRKVAELLIEIASRRVNAKRGRHEEPQEAVYAIQRQARRVKMREEVNITLDGSASFLIDLSTRGAQVLSPVPLRPKQEVRIVLVIGGRAVDCRGRVVWALFEQAKGARGALYRAGVEFVEVDTPGVEAFLSSESVRLQRSA